MTEEENTKIGPVSDVLPVGETIKDIFFIKLPELGGDKMFWVFESGRVLIMPVYRECPVQTGTMDNLGSDLDEFMKKLDVETIKAITERNDTIEQLKELRKWPGQQRIQ